MVSVLSNSARAAHKTAMLAAASANDVDTVDDAQFVKSDTGRTGREHTISVSGAPTRAAANRMLADQIVPFLESLDLADPAIALNAVPPLQTASTQMAVPPS
jgi:hypothetical protein